MIRLSSLALVACLAAGLPGSASAQTDADFRELKAWEAAGPGANGRPTAGGLLLESGTIRTTAFYADVVVRFDYRLPRPGTGGEFHLRSFFDPQGRPGRGYSVTLDDTGKRGRVRALAQQLREHRFATLAPRATPDWIACEIRADGERLTVSLDGVVVSELSHLDAVGGFLGFSTKGGIELRGIRVAPLGLRLDEFPTGLPAATDAGVSAPVPIYQERPVYPRAPFDLRLEGVVQLAIVIDATGRLTHARVVKTPHPDFAMAAVACARKWRFKPAVKDGVPLAVTATMDVAFDFGQ